MVKICKVWNVALFLWRIDCQSYKKQILRIHIILFVKMTLICWFVLCSVRITARIILKGERFFLFGSALATLSGWLRHCCIFLINGMQKLRSLLQLCHRLAWHGITARIILKGERFFLFGSALATLSGWLRYCCIFFSQWYAEVEELAPTLSQVGMAWHYCKDHPKRQTNQLSIDKAKKL